MILIEMINPYQIKGEMTLAGCCLTSIIYKTKMKVLVEALEYIDIIRQADKPMYTDTIYSQSHRQGRVLPHSQSELSECNPIVN